MKAPAYQWYPKDALSDERYRRMTITQRGLYRELLDLQWLEGSIPSDPLEIASCLKVDRRLLRYCLPIVLQMFEATSGDCSRLVNHKLEEQRQKQERFIEAKRNSGRTGAAKRWNDSTPIGSAITAPIAHPMANDSSASAIAIPITNKRKEVEITPLPPLLDNDAFKEAWKEWIDYRKERHLPTYKPIGLKRALNEISSFADPVDAVRFSISKNWNGVYERKETHTNGKSKRHESLSENVRRVDREFAAIGIDTTRTDGGEPALQQPA